MGGKNAEEGVEHIWNVRFCPCGVVPWLDSSVPAVTVTVSTSASDHVVAEGRARAWYGVELICMKSESVRLGKPPHGGGALFFS